MKDLLLISVLAAGVIFALVWFVRFLLAPSYSAKSHLMSKTERDFYKVLVEETRGKYVVFTKVRIADVLATNRTIIKSLWWKRFVKISSKHVDFVLCDASNLSISACVELDDRSHLAKATKKRDRFVNKAFKEAGLKLIRVPVANKYDRVIVPE